MTAPTITRAYLADMLNHEFGFSRAESAEAVDALVEEMVNALEKQGELKVSSFGTFLVRKKAARVGRNPKTKEEKPISARNAISFYPSRLLKVRINDKKAHG